MILTSTIRATLLCATLAGLSMVTSATAAELTVNVHDIRAQTGTLRVALVNTGTAWDGKAAPVQAQQARPQGESAHFTFKDLPVGDYAVLLTHDENDNGKLDTNLVGMPVEGYGFSNNPQVMRKPTFDEARFSVPTTGTAIDISLR